MDFEKHAGPALSPLYMDSQINLFAGGPVIAFTYRLRTAKPIVEVSTNIFAEFGYTAQQFIAGELNWFSLIHPQDSRQRRRKLYHAMRNFSSFFEAEYRIKKADGAYAWVYERSVPIRNNFGKIELFQGYLLGIVEKTVPNEAKPQRIAVEKPYQELVEEANVIMMSVLPTGEILFINEFGAKFFGYTREELVHQSYKELLLPRYESAGRDLWLVYDELFSQPSRHQRCCVENVRSDGRRIWIDWANSLVKSVNGSLMLIAVGVDATARKRAEASLKLNYERFRRNKLINDMLERRIAENDFFAIMEKEGYQLTSPLICCWILFCIEDERLNSLKEDRLEWQSWKDTVTEVLAAHTGGLAWHNEHGIAVMKSAPGLPRRTNNSFSILWTETIVGIVQDAFRGMRYTIGISSVQKEAVDIYRQAREAAVVGPLLHPEQQIHYWQSLGVSKLIFAHINSQSGKEFIRECLGPLIEKSTQRNKEWIRTLEEIISGDSINLIAERLHVHPKTIIFRKRKIEQLLRISVDDPEMRLNLAVALKLRRLQEIKVNWT